MADGGSPLKRESSGKWELGFWSLIATQFQGAFNDNGLKFFVIFLILGTNPTDSQRDLLVFYVGNLFAVPFLLFSMAGGYLAVRTLWPSQPSIMSRCASHVRPLPIRRCSPGTTEPRRL